MRACRAKKRWVGYSDQQTQKQKNVTAILSRASREATGPPPVPDVAASGSTSFKQKKKSD
jgi:hypothetical protein